MKKVLELKEKYFGKYEEVDFKEALTNWGIFWNDNDYEKLENWLKTKIEKNGIEIQVADWFDSQCEEEITSDIRNNIINLIVEDIIRYHEENN